MTEPKPLHQTEQREIYMVITDYHDDCALPHVFYYTSIDKALKDLPNYSKGDVKVVKGIIVAVREDSQH
jgi:hypothetical protein